MYIQLIKANNFKEQSETTAIIKGLNAWLHFMFYNLPVDR